MLLIDLGNSAIKCRFFDGAQNRDQLFHLRNDHYAREFESYLLNLSPDHIYLASVSSQAVTDQIKAIIAKQADAGEFHQLFTLPEINGLKNGYHDHSELGVDRWLTVLAASEIIEGDGIIVDAGSAITIELLSRDQGFIGGAILPGFMTSKEKFVSMFPRIDFTSQDVASLDKPGLSTLECLYLPDSPVTAGSVIELFKSWFPRLQQPCNILLTGQDAQAISLELDEPHRVITDLVFQGMLKQIKLLG